MNWKSTHNSTKVWVFISLSCLSLLFLGYWLGERPGLFIGFILSVSLNSLLFFFGETPLLQHFNAKILNGRDPWGLNSLAKNLCEQWEMPTPKIYLAEHSTAFVFCSGSGLRSSVIGISEGLLKNFSQDEIQTIIAHQLCHIRRMDSFAFGVTSRLANAIMGFAQILDRAWPTQWFKKSNNGFFLSLFLPFGWMIIRGVISSKTYFENDRMAAQLLENDRRVGELLWRLEGIAQTQPLEVPPCTQHLFIVNPCGLRVRSLFQNFHPTMKERLKILMGYYPI